MQVDLIDVYSVRVLVFLEIGAQTNEYTQVLLTPEQYRKVTDDICTVTSKSLNGGIDIIDVTTSEEIYKLDDLKAYT